MVGTVAAGAGVGFDSSFVDLEYVATEVPVSAVTLAALDREEEIQDLSGGLPTHGVYPLRDISSITTRYWHHTASSDNATWEEIAQYHIKNRKWAGIAYHIGIDKEGRIAILNKLERRSNHTAGHNSHGVGIVLLGNYDEHEPSEAMVKAIRKVRKYLDVIDITEDRLHRDVKATICPGRYAVKVLKG